MKSALERPGPVGTLERRMLLQVMPGDNVCRVVRAQGGRDAPELPGVPALHHVPAIFPAERLVVRVKGTLIKRVGPETEGGIHKCRRGRVLRHGAGKIKLIVDTRQGQGNRTDQPTI